MPLQVLGQRSEIFQGLVKALGNHDPSPIDMNQGFQNLDKQSLEFWEVECLGLKLNQELVALVNTNPLLSVGVVERITLNPESM